MSSSEWSVPTREAPYEEPWWAIYLWTEVDRLVSALVIRCLPQGDTIDLIDALDDMHVDNCREICDPEVIIALPKRVAEISLGAGLTTFEVPEGWQDNRS